MHLEKNIKEKLSQCGVQGEDQRTVLSQLFVVKGYVGLIDCDEVFFSF